MTGRLAIMRDEIDRLLARDGRVLSRTTALTVVTRNQFDDEVRRGRLVAVFPRAYTRPWDADDPELLSRAALVSVGMPAALSHTTALHRWQLPGPRQDEVHVSVPANRHPAGQPSRLALHRVRALPPAPNLDGLPTVLPEYAIVGSWPMLRGPDQRAPAIAAVRRRIVTPARLTQAAECAPRLAGARDLGQLISLLDGGCESELEIWGHLEVFDVPGLRHARRQLPISAGGRWYRLDLAFEEERLAIELDGRAYHASPEQWERDIRRDLALATIGWQTIRFSHYRLTRDPAGCRRDALSVLATRRQWRRSG